MNSSTRLLCITLLYFSFNLFLKTQAQPPVPGNWNLVFSDEFDSFNPQYWNLAQPDGKLTLSKGKAAFQAENVYVDNGNLVIVSRREKLEIPKADGKFHKTKFTSGYVDSFGKFTQRYGYIEARMKLPRARGLWPAFWLMPDRGDNFKSNGRRSTYELHANNTSLGKGMEIDIVEHLTKWKPNEMHYAAHWDRFREDLKSFSNGYELKTSPADYITFGLHWAPNLLTWYTDGVEIARLESERVADVPLYLIFSTNMGGWAGDIKAKKLPDYTYIDYVKVWALEPTP